MDEEKIIDGIYKLNLLSIQQLASMLAVISDMISYYAVLEGKQVIEDNYFNNKTGINPMPDRTALQSLYLYLIAKILFTSVGFSRYEFLRQKKINGQFEYSIKPNMDINIGNIFGLIGLLFLIRGAEEIYQRDDIQPIFGVR